MKKIVLLLCSVFLLNSHADIVPEGDWHYVNHKVYITNAEQYADMSLLACVDILGEGKVVYKVKSNEALEKGYKFNNIYVLSIETALLEEYGGIEATKFSDTTVSTFAEKLCERSTEKGALSLGLIVGGSYMEDKYPLKSVALYYELNKSSDANVTLKVKKKIVTFTDDTNSTYHY